MSGPEGGRLSATSRIQITTAIPFAVVGLIAGFAVWILVPGAGPLALLVCLALAAIPMALVMSKRIDTSRQRAKAAFWENWATEQAAVMRNPQTDRAVLQAYLVAPIPHDPAFFYRLYVLRALAQNPALPAELQAAAVNRISQEEAAARIERSLRIAAASTPRTFVGMTWSM